MAEPSLAACSRGVSGAIDIHPGAANRPPSGGRACVDDTPGDGWMHIPLLSEVERDELSRASRRAGWWPWYRLVTYPAWWPDAGLYIAREGIPNPDGALIATFAEFEEGRDRPVVDVLKNIRF